MTKQEIIEKESAVQVLPDTHVPASEEQTLMNLIAKMATDPQADVSKVERLIGLRNEELARRAKAAYDADFVRMKPKLPLVLKTHANAQTKSNYAKLEDINKVIDPILSEFGFGTSSKVVNQTLEAVTMRLEIKHRDGHSESMELTMPVDDKGMAGAVNKTKIHAISSTMTYIKRVGFCALLNISTGDDKDGNLPEPVAEFISIEQAADLDLRARKFGDDYHKKFLQYAKVDDLRKILVKNYKRAVTALEEKEKSANVSS